MKVSLNTPERIMVMSSGLPSENDFATLKLVRKVKDQLGFSEDELKTLSLKSETVGNGLTRFIWDTAKDFQREFELGEKIVDLIVDTLTDLGRQKKATIQHLELLEKFEKAKFAVI